MTPVIVEENTSIFLLPTVPYKLPQSYTQAKDNFNRISHFQQKRLYTTSLPLSIFVYMYTAMDHA